MNPIDRGLFSQEGFPIPLTGILVRGEIAGQGNLGKRPDARIHMQIIKNSPDIRQNLSCILFDPQRPDFH